MLPAELESIYIEYIYVYIYVFVYIHIYKLYASSLSQIENGWAMLGFRQSLTVYI